MAGDCLLAVFAYGPSVGFKIKSLPISASRNFSDVQFKYALVTNLLCSYVFVVRPSCLSCPVLIRPRAPVVLVRVRVVVADAFQCISNKPFRPSAAVTRSATAFSLGAPRPINLVTINIVSLMYSIRLAKVNQK
jgi:hypothetical protein